METPLDLAALEENLSRPTDRLVEAFGSTIQGDLLILGAGGKMGPTLARMARRAADTSGKERRIIAVSRFSNEAARASLERSGVETIACDLLQESSYDALPDAPHVVCMTGFKFGATSNPALTWAMNCYLPALVSKRFRGSQLAVFSSGNVYGMVPRQGGGSVEGDELDPVGEYAVTVMGRERMFQYFSQEWEVPVVLLRLNYATELRYGVLVDVARLVWSGQPIDITMGSVNVIWQADANAMSLQSLALAAAPPRVLNIAGPELVRIRDVAAEFGQIMDREPVFKGEELADAFLSNAGASYNLLGKPATSMKDMVRCTAEWVMQDGDYSGKPTHFQSRDGKY